VYIVDRLPARGLVFRQYPGARPIDEDGQCVCGVYRLGCPGQERAA
jgi:hypothetical protein